MDELAQLQTLDNGIPYALSRTTRVSAKAAADIFDHYAGWIDKITGETHNVQRCGVEPADAWLDFDALRLAGSEEPSRRGRLGRRQPMSDDRRPQGARSPAERMRAGDIATGRREARCP